MNNGTASPSQFIQVMNAISIAVASVIQNFSIWELIKSFKNKGEKLAELMKLVLTAMITDQTLSLKVKFPIWRALNVGVDSGLKSLIYELKNKFTLPSDTLEMIDIKISSLPKFYTSSEIVNLVLVTPKDLGFEEGATWKEIYDSALQHGLKLCHYEIGLYLRLDYDNQLNKEWLRIAMEPIRLNNGLRILAVVNCLTKGVTLDCHSGEPDTFWKPDESFIFTL